MAGRPLIGWSLAAMAAAESVTVVAIAAPVGHEVELERIAGSFAGRPDQPGGFHAIVVTGGDTRGESVGLALAEIPAEASHVAVHDAARPLVSPALVDALVARLVAAPDAAGVIAAAPVADTLKRVAEDGSIGSTESRAGLWAAQTPQVFAANPLRRAHDGDPAEIATATDDAQLIERLGGRVLVEPVTEPNLKVTTPADLRLAAALLAAS